jgi:hypothetical protein
MKFKQNSSNEIENKIQTKLKKSSNQIENKIQTKVQTKAACGLRAPKQVVGISGFDPLNQPALKIGLLLW